MSIIVISIRHAYTKLGVFLRVTVLRPSKFAIAWPANLGKENF